LTTPSDKTLIKAVLAGEKAAYERLYDCYAPLIRAVCYDTTANLADAQDLAQDVLESGSLELPGCAVGNGDVKIYGAEKRMLSLTELSMLFPTRRMTMVLNCFEE